MKESGVRLNLSVVNDRLRSELWPVPALGVFLGLVGGVLLPRLDERVDGRMSSETTTYLFGGGADAARTVLDAVASSTITVTSLTFSLTVVTLQLASSQFSPRLLRTFSRDRVVHVTLALFLATFTFALTVLRTVRTGVGGQDAFVPRLSVTLAFVLALASVLGLVLFLAHLSSEIRVETMLRRVHNDTVGTARRMLPDAADGSSVAPTVPAGAAPVQAAGSGFLVSIDETELLEAAVEAGAVVRIEVLPGSFLVAGTPIGMSWPMAGDTAADEEARDRLHERVAGALSCGPERTAAQDVAFGLQQLTDVAVKALSPGVNDPTTARHALGHVSALLCFVAGRDLGPRAVCDEDGEVRVVLARPGLADLLEQAVSPPRRYGAGDPDVLSRLAVLLRELAWVVEGGEHAAGVRDQLARLRATVAAQDFDEGERHRLNALLEQADLALAGRWSA